MIACISNPPYNINWEHLVSAKEEERFNKCSLPPRGNANYAFILTALDKADKSTLILPNSVLFSSNKSEAEIRKYLIVNNFIESVIQCPDNMFECTNIPTCLITLNKNKDYKGIEVIDMSKKCDVGYREQRGMSGNKSHTARVYKKKFNIFNDSQIDEALDAIKNKKNIKGFCHFATQEELEENDFVLKPNRYIEEEEISLEHRDFNQIIDDINRINRDKNIVKITMNETIAKRLNVDILKQHIKDSNEVLDSMNEMCKCYTEKKFIYNNFFQLSKNKNEIKIENKDREKISDLFTTFFMIWYQHIMYLSKEESRYLEELREALLNDLMSGKIDVSSIILDNTSEDD